MTVRQFRFPDGRPTTQVIADVPAAGLKCICYQDGNRKDIVPSVRPYAVEIGCSGGPRFVCACNNRMRGSQTPFEAMASIIPSPQFQADSAAAVCNEIGLAPKRPAEFVTVLESKGRSNWFVMGLGALVVGGGLLYWMSKKSKKPERAENPEAPHWVGQRTFEDIYFVGLDDDEPRTEGQILSEVRTVQPHVEYNDVQLSLGKLGRVHGMAMQTQDGKWLRGPYTWYGGYTG